MIKVTPYLDFDQEAKQLVDKKSNIKVEFTYSEAAIFGHLLSEPDQIFEKDALLQVGWPDRIVAPTSLTQCISTLRKKLEPYTELQLKTLARRGYQLHISEKSHITMLAVNDAKAIKKALWDVSLLVKVGGVLLLLAAMAYYWYLSDLHKVIQQANRFNADETIELKLGGAKADITLLHGKSETALHPSMWQKHIAPETNMLNGADDLNGFALAMDGLYSMATCIHHRQDDCAGKDLINLAIVDHTKPAGLDMIEFAKLREVMESRIRYNRQLVPAVNNVEGEIEEHHYHGDVYFPVADKLLVRADIGMSVVYQDPLQGQFYFSACFTDADCLTTPIKYHVRGQFEQYRQKMGDFNVEVFHVKVEQKDLIRPSKVSDSAMYFYREIRKHNIRDDEMFFYRLSKNTKGAVWIVPLIKDLVVWTDYEKVML